MGYAYVDDFGVKDSGGKELSIKIIDEDTLEEAVSDFSKEDIDRIIELLQTEREKKWSK